jgi:iron complex outermembrane recepter protein
MRKTRPLALIIVPALAVALGMKPLAAAAQQQLQRVEITGSSIKRIDAETALPVQVITRAEIERTGASTVEQLLQTVTAISSSGGLTASSVSGAATGSISSVSLRGLTSIRTLVLINGRRIAPYGIGFTGDSVSVDVNSIPLAAIERVEVLKDGASAIYGSDAVAGVINFILRKDYHGAEISGHFGDSSGGGARLSRVAATWGLGDLGQDRFNLMLVGSFQKEEALFGAQRRFARSSVTPETGNDGSSGNTFPANITAVDGSFGDFNPANPGCPLPYSIYVPSRTTTACRFDPSPLVQLVPQAERMSLFASARLALSTEIEAYLEASYNRNKQNNIIQPVPISDQFALPPNHPLFGVAPYNGFSTIVLSASSPFYPTSYVQSITGGPTPDLLVRYRAAVNGNRDITDVSEAPRLALGVKGALAGWDFDGGFLHSNSKVAEQVNDGFPSLSAILPLLNRGNVNFFGPNSAAIDAQLRATNFTGHAFDIESTLNSLYAKVTRELTQLPAGPLAVALGSEFRFEKYLFNASPAIQTGDISGYGGNFLNTDRTRKVGALFAEVNLPIVKGLEASAAVRFDKYQGVGNSTTPKASLRWQPARELLLRASIGKGFRAPSLQDLYLPQITGVTTPGLSDSARCPSTNDGVKDCSTQFPILNGGNAALKPERSISTTVGLVLEPTSNISLTLDAFKIDLKETIVNGVPAPTILGDLVKYGALVTRGPVDPAFPLLPGPITQINQTNINLGQTKLSGFDFDARFRLPATEFGKITLSYSGTYFSKYDTENPDGTFTPNVDTVNNTTGGLIPRLRTYLSATWARGPWTVSAAQNWQGGYQDIVGSRTGAARQVGAYETYDLQTQYSGLKNLQLTLGVKNILNRDPPFTNSGGQVSFQAGYDPQYADPRGRFVYVSATYQFK